MLGNLIVKVGEGKEKIMLCSHMDSIGLLVSFIEENGLIRVEKTGDFNYEDVSHSIIKFKNGTIGKLILKDKELYIDIGLKKREEVLKVVEEGDQACFFGELMEMGNKNLIAPNLDNRVGCYILITLLKRVKNLNKEVYFLFSTQEELGARGARAAAYSINPDYCIVVDLEEANNLCRKSNIKLGDGPAIKVMDKTLIIHHEVKKMLEESADLSKVKIQYSVSNSRSEGGTIHKERMGIKTGELSIPCKYKHCASEIVNINDIENSIKLLESLLIN